VRQTAKLFSWVESDGPPPSEVVRLVHHLEPDLSWLAKVIIAVLFDEKAKSLLAGG